MSGFFVVARDRIDVDRLRPRGFKILLEIIGPAPAPADDRAPASSSSPGTRGAARPRSRRAPTSRGSWPISRLRARLASRTDGSYDIHRSRPGGLRPVPPRADQVRGHRVDPGSDHPGRMCVDSRTCPRGENIDLTRATARRCPTSSGWASACGSGSTDRTSTSRSRRRWPGRRTCSTPTWSSPCCAGTSWDCDHALVHAACVADRQRRLPGDRSNRHRQDHHDAQGARPGAAPVPLGRPGGRAAATGRSSPTPSRSPSAPTRCTPSGRPI